jgi:cell division protein FtsB
MRALNITLLLLFVALQTRIWIGEGSVGHIVALDKKIEAQQTHNAKLRARNDVLAAEVIDLQNGYATIEAYARSELGMIKPGETFFLVVQNKSPNKQGLHKAQ